MFGTFFNRSSILSGANPFIPGENDEFLVLDLDQGVTLDTPPNIKIIADQGSRGDDYQQLVALDQPEQNASDADYNSTDSAVFDDVNTFMATLLAKSTYRFLHDGTTKYALHLAWKPDATAQIGFSNQGNLTIHVGITIRRLLTTMRFSLSNGSAILLDISASGWSDGDVRLVQVIIDPADTGFEGRMRISGNSEATAAKVAGSYDTGDAERDATFGADGGGQGPMGGTISFLAIKKNPTDQYIFEIRQYLNETRGVAI